MAAASFLGLVSLLTGSVISSGMRPLLLDGDSEIAGNTNHLAFGRPGSEALWSGEDAGVYLEQSTNGIIGGLVGTLGFVLLDFVALGDAGEGVGVAGIAD